jgi:hypothetical protein
MGSRAKKVLCDTEAFPGLHLRHVRFSRILPQKGKNQFTRKIYLFDSVSSYGTMLLLCDSSSNV